MKRIISCALASSAIFAVALGSADAATPKHHTGSQYSAVASKLRTIANRRLAVSEPSQTSVGSIRDNSATYEVQKWGLLGP